VPYTHGVTGSSPVPPNSQSLFTGKFDFLGDDFQAGPDFFNSFLYIDIGIGHA
jgi:hypothetical protein